MNTMRITTAALIAALIGDIANLAMGQTIGVAPKKTQPSDVPRTETRPVPAAANQTTSWGVGRTSRSQDSVPPVIIGFGAKDAAGMESMDEELAIMNRVLDRALEKGLGEDAPQTKLGVRLLYTSGSRSVRPLYLEGFGALFMIKVSFPLTGSVRPEEKTPEKPSSDSEWERARRELLGRDGSEDGAVWRGSAPAFDQAQVDGLKEVLLQALKDASNMHGLKADEFVSISVFGSPTAFAGKPRTAGGGFSRQTENRFADADNDAKTRVASRAGSLALTPYPSSQSGAGTVMTLRAKKADIDAFAEGKLSLDAFKGKVTSYSYLGNGHDITSVNSWIQSSSSSSIYQAR